MELLSTTSKRRAKLSSAMYNAIFNECLRAGCDRMLPLLTGTSLASEKNFRTSGKGTWKDVKAALDEIVTDDEAPMVTRRLAAAKPSAPRKRKKEWKKPAANMCLMIAEAKSVGSKSRKVKLTWKAAQVRSMRATRNSKITISRGVKIKEELVEIYTATGLYMWA
ncbi:hypothetical protein D918_01716 [Trichuris suis]|nr:hypothetical protein D918_01716 [Trichuris suis]